MTVPLHELVEANLAAITAKDLDRALAGFAPDGELIDPHYPRPHMTGHAQIAAGLRWVFSGMRELNFVVDRYFPGPDGRSIAAEVTSDHVLRGGRGVHVRQTFVVDARDDLITRWQAYVTYGPHGIAGIARRLGALGRTHDS